jgi:hypothetical protein
LCRFPGSAKIGRSIFGGHGYHRLDGSGQCYGRRHFLVSELADDQPVMVAEGCT